MDRRFIENIILLFCLILVQVLACNHILLFNVAVAFVFIYVIIRLPMDLSVNWILTWAFFSGFIVDMFSDTPGVNSLSCTIIAILRKPMLYAYVPRDDATKNIVPSIQSLGFNVYGKYLFSMSLIYCLLAFSIEYFNFANVKEITIMTFSSSVFTFLILLGVDSIIGTKREKRI